MSPTLRVTCAGCLVLQVQPVTALLVADDGALLMFACFVCGTGHQDALTPADRTAALFSGAAVRAPGETGWPLPRLLGHPPSRPATYPRQAPITLLARLVQSLRIL